jgi:hypothetical protein
MVRLLYHVKSLVEYTNYLKGQYRYLLELIGYLRQVMGTVRLLGPS